MKEEKDELKNVLQQGKTVESKTIEEAIAVGDESRFAFDERMGVLPPKTNEEMQHDFDKRLKIRTTEEIVKNVLHVVPRFRALSKEKKDVVSKATANMIDEFFGKMEEENAGL